MVFNRWLPPSLRFVVTTPSLRLMVFGMATLAVAAISWCLIEQPINRLRARITGKTLGPALSYHDGARPELATWNGTAVPES